MVASGKLLKADINGSPQMSDRGRHILDSTGHIIRKDRKVLNRGELEEDNGQYDVSGKMFGVCTAAAMFKVSALKNLELAGEYFDESFGSHKEDVDICWRAWLYGYECYYEAGAAAYHCRSWPKGKKRGAISRQVRTNSFKNRYLMMLKNETLKGLLRDLPHILFYELKAIISVLFREPYLLLAYLRMIRLLPLTLGKRRRIMIKKIIQDSETMKWFV
jgi:GT2 family glycosyltransferase